MSAEDPFLVDSPVRVHNMQNGSEKYGLPDYSGREIFGMVDFSHKAALETANKDKKRPSWKETWIDFTQNTTIHGLRFIWMEHAFLARKLLWLLLVMACAGLMSYQIIDRIIYYYNYPVTVNVNVNFNKTLTFPSLTLCNQNTFRATQATEQDRYRLLEAMYTGSGDLNSSTLTNYNATHITVNDLFLSTAHSKYDLIVDCEWQSEKCGPENFTMILTDHGVCFTFNADHSQPLLVASTGSEYGLKLTLNVEQYEYMPGPHDAAGVKLLLHDGKEFPGVAELGLAIPTGTHAYVGIQVVQIENLPQPHGNCGSLTSPYYRDYSTDNCQLACLTDYVMNTCGCRHHYMPHQGGRLKERVREECTCPIPCSFLIFDPALSFATTSVFATDRLLAAASHTNDLETKYLAAMETTNRMEEIKFQRFVSMEAEARQRLDDLSALMQHDVKDAIERTEMTIDNVSNVTRAVWEAKERLYRWQEYHVLKNFMRPRDAMEERTFNFLAMGFQEYANLTESQIWNLADPNITSPEVRQSLYTLVMTTFNAKIDLANRAFDNYTQLYSSYFNGTPIFRYKFENEHRSRNPYISPRPLLRHSLLHSAYSRRYSARVGQDIIDYRDAVQRLADLATEAYENQTVSKDDMYYADVNFLYRGRRYLHSRSTFYFESIDYPVRVIRERMAAFQRLWRNYDTIIQESAGNVQSLKLSLDNLQNSILRRLNSSMRMARSYIVDSNVTKLDIARELTSQNIYIGISDLKIFFQSLRSRGQKIFDNWEKIAEATNAIWDVVIHDEDMLEYYNFKNITQFLRNMSEVAEETMAEFKQYGQMYDFRYLVGSSDSLFLKSLTDLMSDMEQYLKASVIGTDFIRENFLQLDVFYREKSYEQITQQTAYDEFALLCDIGGSMGLFVGASVLSIGELIDLFFNQGITRITHRSL